MRLLFIKLKHIGDSLLLTPTLTAARRAYPQAEIWVVVRRGCEGILAGCPAADRVLTAAAPEADRRAFGDTWQEMKLVRELRRQHFDHAFELTDGDRGRWLAWLSGAKVRATNVALRPLNLWWRGRFNAVSTFDWARRHRVEKDFRTVSDVLPLGETIPPLVFEAGRAKPWAAPFALTEFAVIHPGTRWQRKRWPKENWLALAKFLQTKVPRLVISAGPDAEERALAGDLRAALGDGVVSTDGRADWAELAGLLHRAKLFVGVDTAAMHLAAACQCPTVAIFGPSVIAQWRPWGVAHRIVTPRQILAEAVIPARDEPDAMTTAEVPLARVIAAVEELLAECRR